MLLFKKMLCSKQHQSCSNDVTVCCYGNPHTPDFKFINLLWNLYWLSEKHCSSWDLLRYWALNPMMGPVTLGPSVEHSSTEPIGSTQLTRQSLPYTIDGTIYWTTSSAVCKPKNLNGVVNCQMNRRTKFSSIHAFTVSEVYPTEPQHPHSIMFHKFAAYTSDGIVTYKKPSLLTLLLLLIPSSWQLFYSYIQYHVTHVGYVILYVWVHSVSAGSITHITPVSAWVYHVSLT